LRAVPRILPEEAELEASADVLEADDAKRCRWARSPAGEVSTQ
jgi:hypothetical protein